VEERFHKLDREMTNFKPRADIEGEVYETMRNEITRPFKKGSVEYYRGIESFEDRQALDTVKRYAKLADLATKAKAAALKVPFKQHLHTVVDKHELVNHVALSGMNKQLVRSGLRGAYDRVKNLKVDGDYIYCRKGTNLDPVKEAERRAAEAAAAASSGTQDQQALGTLQEQEQK